MTGKPYKNVTIIRASSGDWRVRYEFEIPNNPGKFKKFYVRDGINYIKDPDLKEKEAERLREDLLFYLDHGFNPFLADRIVDQQVFAEDTITKMEEEIEKEEIRPWTLLFALNRYMRVCEFKGLSEATIGTYLGYVNALRRWLNYTNQLDMLAFEFSSEDAHEYLFERPGEWKARTYNNHAKFLPGLFREMEKAERRENSKSITYEDISDLLLKVDRAERNRAYTGAAADQVKRLLQAHPKLERYVKWIYFSCMRPREIRLLQVQHINIKARQIKVVGETGKTGDRFVPISDELLELVNEMDIDKMPYGYYPFGRAGEPSEQPVGKKYYSDEYREKIRLPLGLDDKYTPYGWKHTRVIELLSSGKFDDYQVMSLTGHQNFESFQAYKRDLVIDNSSMKGKTIGF